MLFMVIEHFRPGRMAPEGLRYVASRVDLKYERCFQVMETDDESLLVRTSAEAAAAIAEP